MSSTTLNDNWELHWQRYAASARNNPAQQYRRDLICAILKRLIGQRTARIADIGSGQGDLLQQIRDRFTKPALLGIDQSLEGIAIARTKVPSASFLAHDITSAPSAHCEYTRWAEYAICSEVLEHLDEPETALRALSGFLAPGATLLVTVPGGPMSAFDKHIGHRRHYNPPELAKMLLDAGFMVEAAFGAGFPFFNLYRTAVILRGRKLISDAVADTTNGIPARLLAGVFRTLFTMNLNHGQHGWQTLAIARWNNA